MEDVGNSNQSSLSNYDGNSPMTKPDQQQRQVDDILQHQQTVLAEMRENLEKLRAFKGRLIGYFNEEAKSPQKEEERIPDSVAGKLQMTMEDMYQTQTEIREIIHALEGFA